MTEAPVTDNLAGELHGLSLERAKITPIIDFSLLPTKNTNNNNCSEAVNDGQKLDDSAYESISDMQESPNNDEVKPVFSDKLFCYSSDEGFEGSPANLPSTPTRKIRYCWKSPTKPSSSVAPYLIEASPIRIQRKKKESQSSPKTQNIDTRCDFISQLAARNMDIIIQQIFGHCGNRELQKASEVNRQWRSYLTREPFNSRRATYRAEKSKRDRNPNFNRARVSPNWRAQKLRSSQNHQNRVMPQTSPVTRSRLTSDDGLFVRPRIQHLKVVKRNLGLGEEMIYCPKCEYPATKMTDNKGRCTMSKCQAIFCCLCKANWHGSRSCDDHRPRTTRTRKKLAKL